ncbi:MAG: amidohydrolase family protein [Bacteroidales bacterium]|nr:amidohydrolase family protein [Bacteroidales bacterium]
MNKNSTLIHNATIVNEGRIFVGSVLIEGDRIAAVYPTEAPLADAGLPSEGPRTSQKEGRPVQHIRSVAEALASAGRVVDATGMLLLPGVIDTHVHFRDGGESENPAGTFHSESRAARAGGVTSVVDMPNTKPQTVSLDALEAKETLAARDSAVNYAFMLGATNDNIDTLLALEPTRYAAIKLFLGSSTGNMLVNDPGQLDRLFREAKKLIVAHCEEERVVQANLANAKREYQGTGGETAALHPKIRNNEACFLSTYHAIERARKYGTRFHVAHISTATELSLLSNFDLKDKLITAEVTPNHLWFDDRDYATLGNLIKCNPAIKSADDRLALWAALEDGLIDTIATDHAPHPLEAKQRPYFDAPSGIPSIQHSLQMMLEVVFGAEGSAFGTPHSEPRIQNPDLLATIVAKMCHNPALLFGIEGRGFIRPDDQADLVLVRPGVEETVTRESLLYKCGWSPLEGQTFHTRVERVWVNGHDDGTGAEALCFSR